MGEQPALLPQDVPMDTQSATPHHANESQLSGAPSSKASPRPLSLPKAPLSQEVAKRLLRNATVRPVQRFDSADYFLQLHQERSKGASSAESTDVCDAEKGTTQLRSDRPTIPPPLSRDDGTGTTELNDDTP